MAMTCEGVNNRLAIFGSNTTSDVNLVPLTEITVTAFKIFYQRTASKPHFKPFCYSIHELLNFFIVSTESEHSQQSLSYLLMLWPTKLDRETFSHLNHNLFQLFIKCEVVLQSVFLHLMN